MRAPLSAAQAKRLLEVWQSPCPFILYFDFVDSLQDTFLKVLRQGCVLEVPGHFLAVFHGPF